MNVSNYEEKLKQELTQEDKEKVDKYKNNQNKL